MALIEELLNSLLYDTLFLIKEKWVSPTNPCLESFLFKNLWWQMLRRLAVIILLYIHKSICCIPKSNIMSCQLYLTLKNDTIYTLHWNPNDFLFFLSMPLEKQTWYNLKGDILSPNLKSKKKLMMLVNVLTLSSSSSAAEIWDIYFLGITRKCVGAWGEMSWKARHWSSS